MTRSRWGLVILGFAFFAYAVSAIRLGFAPYDDGIFAYGGMAVARGHIPYEDFWTLYNPGQFLLIGAFFRFVTESVLAFRVFESLVIAASGIVVWDVGRRLYSRKVALVSSCVFVLWMGAGSSLYPFHENHTLTSMFLVVASLDLLLAAVPAERARLAAAAGACAGICFVIRQDAALYVVLPQLFSLVVWRAISAHSWRRITRTAIAYVAGAATPIVALLAWVLAAAPADWWDQAVVFPITQNPALRDLPYTFSSLDFKGFGGVLGFITVLAGSARTGFFFYLPFLVALFACAVVIVYLRRKAESPLRDLWGFATVTLLLAASLDYSRVRSDFEHVFPSILLAFLVVPGVIAVIAATIRLGVARRATLALGMILAVFTLMIPTAARLRATEGLRQGVRMETGPLAGIVIDNRDAGGSSDWGQVQAAAAYVAERTSSDERIFVSTARNDRLFTNYPAFYVLADRMAGTRHAELYPGVTTTEATQREIVAELDEAGVRYVVRWPVGEQPCSEPNLACVPETPGATLLDEYLLSEYEPAASFGVIEIRERRT